MNNPVPISGCLHLWFENQADKHSASTAVVYQDQTLTYRELNEQANQLAHHLIASGVRPGDIVALALPRDINLIPSLIGILKAGAGYAPIDPNYPRDRIEFVLSDCNAAAVVTVSATAQRLGLESETLVLIDHNNYADADPAAANRHNPTVTMTPDPLAYVIYTSGSTGKPKGVLVSHQNVVNLLWGMKTQGFFSENDVALGLSLIHI